MAGQRESSATMRVTLRKEARMRGDDERQASVWSYVPLEQRVPADHPLRGRRARVRGDSDGQQSVWSYAPREQRVPADHPLRPMRAMVDEVLRELSPQFNRRYATVGRPSIAPERLLRALLLQVLYSVRSERLLMVQIDYNLLFRWFAGLSADDPIWDATVFTKNRQRLLEGDIARAFFDRVVAQARQRGLLSDEHFTVDGTLVEAWASLKSFKPKGTPP